MDPLATELADVVRANVPLMQVMRTVRGLGLPDWRVFSGAVYQTVWNARTGRPADYGIKDYDVGYFDPDTSWEAEDVWIRRVGDALEAPLRAMVEVRNQARVHLWFEERFGEEYTALSSTDEALERFVAPAFAVGVRLEPDDTISIAAPFGLEDVVALRLRPNPRRPLARGWAKAVGSAQARWPEVRVG